MSYEIHSSKIANINLTKVIYELTSIESDQKIVLYDKKLETYYASLLEQISSVPGCILMALPEGEAVKSFQNYELYMEKLIEKRVHRGSHLVAFGGGATSDFVGFLAATCLRGLDWSVIPTTLLAMIDAAVGGKVAINSKFGKNLVGAFHKPEIIWICDKFLKTLDQEHFDSGLGELVKYGLLSGEINENILSKKDLSPIIELSSRFKEVLTTEDFRENSKRKILNLGHTIGHALEKKYGVPHGKAVLEGLVIEHNIFVPESSVPSLLFELIEALGLKLSPSIKKEDIPELVDLCFRDKKMVSTSTLEFVVATNVENVESRLVTEHELTSLLNDYL